MLTLTSAIDTWAHRIPAGAKLALLCFWTVVLFQLSAPLSLGVAAALVAALVLSCGANFAATSARMLFVLWPFVVIVALWHLWTDDLHGGLVILLRMLTAVAAANFVTMTTRLADIIAVITRIGRPLAAFGLSPRAFALAVALMIRFIPVMLRKVAAIRESFRARSARRPGWRLLVPAILAALDDAESAAEALRSRGGVG